MSNIFPVTQQSVITIYKKVPWDNSYRDVRLFETEAQRNTYFAGLEHYTFEKCSVAKLGTSFKIPGNLNDMSEFSYMTFENPGLGTGAKRYYAFITGISYVNTVTTEIQYEIDWIQSFLFLFEYEACIVEREHVDNDGIGLHTVPENLETGEYIADGDYYKTFSPAVIFSFLPDESTASLQNGVLSCAITSGDKDLTSPSNLNTALRTFNDAPERIIQVTMCVAEMLDNGYAPKVMQEVINREKPGPVVRENGETYTIKNNKARIYPYFFLSVDNFMGNIEQYHWELFPGPYASFRIEGTPVPRPIMECSPIGYAMSDGEFINQGMSVVYDNFPSCPYANDTYKAWASQYGFSRAASLGATVASGLINIAGAGIFSKTNFVGSAVKLAAGSAAIDTGRELVSQAVDKQQHQIHSQQMQGGISQAGLNYATSRIGFRVKEYRPRLEAIKRIDGFFTRYGYRVDRVKVPYMNNRKFVNFVKCVNATVGGKVPQVAKTVMENTLNAGVSFWHVDTIGMQLNENPIMQRR